jgi:hypothetical protein
VHIILRVGLSWVFVQMTCFSPRNGRSDRVFNGALAQELGIGSHFTVYMRSSLFTWKISLESLSYTGT